MQLIANLKEKLKKSTSEGADQKMEACMQQMEEIYMKMSAVYGAHLTGSE